MIDKFRRQASRLAFRLGERVSNERQLILSGQARAHQIRRVERLRTLADAEFRVFSQWGEDGILSWLIDTIGAVEPRFVEFGVETFREANCRYLLQTRNWQGLVIDGSDANISEIRQQDVSWRHDLASISAFITRDNINQLIKDAGFAGDLGILSVDIDGVDYWVLEAIEIRAVIIVLEYNDLFSGRPVSVPYDPAFSRFKAHFSGAYWGASIDAFRYLLEARGYTFVGSNLVGTNGFFVASTHAPRVLERLEEIKAWPCRIRDIRQQEGALAYATYREALPWLADLPLIDVASEEEITVADLAAD